jgi:predicted glycosyltransferase involved in capsule biosynthesis
MVHKIAIVMPWYDSGDPYRRRAMRHVYKYLVGLDIADIIIGKCSDIPLNRARMRNNGARNAIAGGYEYLFFNDADCLIDKSTFLEMFELMQQTDSIIYPYNKIPVSLSESQSEEIYGGRDFNDFVIDAPSIAPLAGNFGCKASTFLRLGGLDEGYKGWGYEDTDFTHASSRFIHKIKSMSGSVIELYHLPTDKKNDSCGPATIKGTIEYKQLRLNRFRFQVKSKLNFDQWFQLHNKDILNIVVPAVRHGVAERFMENTDFPVYAVIHKDKVLAKEWSRAGAKILNSSGKTFAQKCNYAYEKTDAGWLLFIGEDVVFQDNWYKDLELFMTKYSVVGTNDLLHSSKERSTHLIISTDYIRNHGGSWDGPNKVFHEYIHNFTDTETVNLARKRKVWGYSQRCVIEHLHHINNKSQIDGVYRDGNDSFTIDKQEYNQRLRQHRSYK